LKESWMHTIKKAQPWTGKPAVPSPLAPGKGASAHNSHDWMRSIKPAPGKHPAIWSDTPWAPAPTQLEAPMNGVQPPPGSQQTSFEKSIHFDERHKHKGKTADNWMNSIKPANSGGRHAAVKHSWMDSVKPANSGGRHAAAKRSWMDSVKPANTLLSPPLNSKTAQNLQTPSFAQFLQSAEDKVGVQAPKTVGSLQAPFRTSHAILPSRRSAHSKTKTSFTQFLQSAEDKVGVQAFGEDPDLKSLQSLAHTNNRPNHAARAPRHFSFQDSIQAAEQNLEHAEGGMGVGAGASRGANSLPTPYPTLKPTLMLWHNGMRTQLETNGAPTPAIWKDVPWGAAKQEPTGPPTQPLDPMERVAKSALEAKRSDSLTSFNSFLDKALHKNTKGEPMPTRIPTNRPTPKPSFAPFLSSVISAMHVLKAKKDFATQKRIVAQKQLWQSAPWQQAGDASEPVPGSPEELARDENKWQKRSTQDHSQDGA
jgi:hypothetical protein